MTPQPRAAPTNAKELVEMMALAGHCARRDAPNPCDRACVACVRDSEAGLAALSAAGLAVVSRECTEEMADASTDAYNADPVSTPYTAINAAVSAGDLLKDG